MLKLFSSYGRTSGVPYFEQENESTLNIPKMIRTFELGFFFFFFLFLKYFIQVYFYKTGFTMLNYFLFLLSYFLVLQNS
jgi:hypothetical protein